MKFGKETSHIHITCFAHAIHLCVCDVLYKPHTMSDAFINNVTEEEDDYDEEMGEENVKYCRLKQQFATGS